jgi:hypothetical protein
MESKLSKQLEADLIAAMRRLSPEQKLNAFLAHCQLIMELYQGVTLLARPIMPSSALR